MRFNSREEMIEAKKSRIAEYIFNIMNELGYDVDGDPSLVDTPMRVAKHMLEYKKDPIRIADLKSRMKEFEEEGYDEIIIKRGIHFNSMCEHHLLPYVGSADIAYLPGLEDPQANKLTFKVIGTSKLARIVEHFAGHFSIQERLTREIADFIDAVIKPRGIWVILRAHHMCEGIRGVKNSSEMVTSVITGVFRDDPEARREAQFLMGGETH